MTRLRKFKKNKGFTIIELMVAAAIVGIILAIAIPFYIEVRDKDKYDFIGGTIELPDGSIYDWGEIKVIKFKEDPTVLYLSIRSDVMVKVFKLENPEIITIEKFKGMRLEKEEIRKKEQAKEKTKQ